MEAWGKKIEKNEEIINTSDVKMCWLLINSLHLIHLVSFFSFVHSPALLPSHSTPRHATPRHTTPHHAKPHQTQRIHNIIKSLETQNFLDFSFPS
ncbi:hypothetical protein E2C01_020686 [Portunus trituberculatus]|uniref:Uncharacterized protein n=1 Tax=Portunus trituberculatus TaxID=210409 RepID=A0A5B7E279_PORTR|nr:hypothetical protein [Portunus trituberculatus]